MPRPEYRLRAKELRENPVTKKYEPYMPPKERASWIMGVFSVVFFFIGLIFTAVLGVIVFRAALYAVSIKQDVGSIRAKSKNIVSVSASIINFVSIQLLKIVYRYIALWLTKWENPGTNTDYTNSLVLKMFWFQFVNTYSSIFYVAFFKNPNFAGTSGRYHRFTTTQFRLEGCSEQGCFLELTIQSSILMMVSKFLKMQRNS